MTDMLKLLKIVDKVEKPVMINEAVSLNISANGDSPEDITSILGKLVNLSNPTQVTDKMMPQGDHHDSMMKTIADVGNYADEAGHAYADEVGEEWANEPEPEVSDVEYMTKDIAGGLNKPKKQFKKEYPGDNPMTMEGSLANKLMVEYKNLIENDDKNKDGKVVHCSQCSKGFKLNQDTAKKYHTGFSHCKDHKGHKMVASEGMGASTIKHKQKLSHMTDKEFADHPHYAKMSDDNLRSMAWRHGHGKPGTPGHDHYVNRRNKGKTTDEATDPRDSRREYERPNNTGNTAWDRLATRLPSDSKRSKKWNAGQQSGLKSSIKSAMGKHGPKGHLPEATDKKPTDDAKKKKKAEKIKAYRADRDKHGED